MDMLEVAKSECGEAAAVAFVSGFSLLKIIHENLETTAMGASSDLTAL